MPRPRRAAPSCFSPLGQPARRRLRQVARYLAAHWPPPLPTRLRIERMSESSPYVAETYRSPSGAHLTIRLDRRMAFDHAYRVLLHEWAHAAIWPLSVRQEKDMERRGHPIHDAAWQAVYGQIVAAFEDDDAVEDSRAW